MSNKLLAEAHNFKQAFETKDLNGAATTGARVKLDQSERCSLVLSLASSASAGAVIANLKQHDAASGGNTKALSVANSYFHKVGAATSFTKVEQSSASDTVDAGATFGTDGGILIVEVLDSDLDVNGGFAWFSVDLDDYADAAGRLAGGVYELHGLSKQPGYGLDV